MKTTILYKVLYVDNLNCFCEVDFDNLNDAQTFANSVNDIKILQYEIIEKVTEII